jgi:hypothetical protein
MQNILLLIKYGSDEVEMVGNSVIMTRTKKSTEDCAKAKKEREEEEKILKEQNELYELEHDPPTILVKVGCVVLGIFGIFMLIHGVPPPFFGGQKIPRRKRTDKEISNIKNLINT